jgi:two-component system, OmpR family, sensor kinase
VLKAELEVTLRNGGFNEEVGAALESAVEEVDQLARLAEDLLLIARSQDGELAVKREQIDVRELLEGVAERYRQRAALEGRSLKVDAPVDLEAKIDPLRIRQAVAKLIDDALRHGAGRVCVRASHEDDSLAFSVSDEGPGFPTEFVDRAFLRFSRADPSRKRGGAGLGLAIVRAIARGHGGDAQIEPADRGSTVVLRLPLA